MTAAFSYRMAIIVMKAEDAIAESLEILDERYGSLVSILEKPIFFDSIEVRQAIDDIRKSRDAILFIASSMALIIDEDAVAEKSESETLS